MAIDSTVAATIVETLGAVIDHRGAYYFSTPITSGRRYLEWLDGLDVEEPNMDQAEDNLRSHHHSEVIIPNVLHAQRAISNIRERATLPVIDPTALSPKPSWTQADWRELWAEVIRRYAIGVFFVDDWEYSKGCVFEFLTAVQKRLPCYTESGDALVLTSGIRLINDAASAISDKGASSEFFTNAARELEAFATRSNEIT